MSAFLKIKVVPAYGNNEIAVLWKTVPELAAARFFIYRSDDGVTGWVQVGQVDGGSYFLDRLVPRGNQTDTYYKVVLQAPGVREDSDIVATFGDVPRREFGMAAVILRDEFTILRLCLPIKIARLRHGGARCQKCSDKQTGQRLATTLCAHCFGTGFAGGFHAPVDSFMRKLDISQKAVAAKPDGNGTLDMQGVKMRTLALPLLEKEDMVVEPDADRRHLVDVVDVHYVNGRFPVLQEATLTLLPRTDVRYKFPLTS